MSVLNVADLTVHRVWSQRVMSGRNLMHGVALAALAAMLRSPRFSAFGSTAGHVTSVEKLMVSEKFTVLECRLACLRNFSICPDEP